HGLKYRVGEVGHRELTVLETAVHELRTVERGLGQVAVDEPAIDEDGARERHIARAESLEDLAGEARRLTLIRSLAHRGRLRPSPGSGKPSVGPNRSRRGGRCRA